MKNKDTQQLGVSVYIRALRKEIEEEVHSKYWKRINYLVGANNELMKELEQCDKPPGHSLQHEYPYDGRGM